MESLWTVYNVCVYMADVLSYFCFVVRRATDTPAVGAPDVKG
jgi:hypothetical protein